MVKKIIIFLLTLVFGIRYSVFSVFAETDFDTKFVIDYKYDDRGQLTVLQKINITYNNSQKYVSKYRFKILGTNISNLTAYDSNGPLEIFSIQEKDGILVETKMNSAIAGKGKNLAFAVSYIGNKATNNGKVWEMSLPRIENWHQTKEIILNLIVPKKMGQLAFVSPNPSTTSLNYSADYQMYSFSKERLGDNQITAAFGNLQSLDFDLTYHLDNKGKISIPSDDSYQRIYISSIEPAPSNISIDGDGNWVAEYLNLSNPTDIRVRGQAHVLSFPIKLSAEPTYEDLQKYLIPSSGSLTQMVFGYNYSDTRRWDWGKHTWISENSSEIDNLVFVHQKKSDPVPNLFLTKANFFLSEYEERGFSPLLITWTPPWQLFSLFSTSSSIEIYNPNGQAVYHLPVQIIQSNLKLEIPISSNRNLKSEISVIPPLGKVVLPLTFLPDWKTNFNPKSFTVFVGGQEITYNVDKSLFLFWHGTLSIIIAIIVLFIGWIAVLSWRVHLQKHTKGHHIRRES